jgi:hypothetical protein
LGTLGAIILLWGGRTCSLVFFISGMTELTTNRFHPRVPEMLLAITAVLLPMLCLILGELVGAILFDINPYREKHLGNIELRQIRQRARVIFEVLGMGIRAVANVSKIPLNRNRTR